MFVNVFFDNYTGYEEKNHSNSFTEQSGSKIAGLDICIEHIHQKNVTLKAFFS